jgi:tight adherence protein B
MALVFGLVFLGAFAVVVLVGMATASPSSQKAKQMLATLDSALATDSPAARDQILNLRKSELLSSIPWLNEKLLKMEIAPMLQRLLTQADLKWTAGGLISAMCLLVVVVGYGLYWKTGLILVALPAGLLVGFLPLGYVFNKRGRRFNKFIQVLPEALDLMVSALRAGHSLIAAMGLVSRECGEPVQGEFKITFEEQNYGLELKTAMDNLVNRVPMQDLRIVATAIMIQKESGGNLAEVLEKTSHVIRERFRLKRQVAVHTAQGRMTGWVLTLLPIVLAFALYLINPEMMSILWTTPVGKKLLWAAGSMIVVGGFIIRQIVNMDV